MAMTMNPRKKALRRAIVAAAVPLGMLITLGAMAPQRAAGQTAEEVVTKVLAARGGLEKAKAIQSERITGTIYFNPEVYGPFLAEFKRPGKMHNELTIQNKTVVRTFNGKDAGWIVNPFVGKGTPEAMTTEDIKDAQNESDFDGPLIDAKAKGNTVELGGTEKVDGKDAYILKVTHKDGTVSSFSFDAKTYLLVKWSGTEDNNGQSITRETFYHDYREVGGLKFAFEVISDNPGQELTQRVLVEKIELDPQIDDSHFGKPPAPAAPPAAAPPSADPPQRRR
jgi:outer membrane lipoprotein-sorting protein